MPTTSSANQRLADVRAEVADAGDGPELHAAAVVMRRISGCEVPGVVSQCIRKSRSLNEGSSSWPSSGTTRMPARATDGDRGVRPARAADQRREGAARRGAGAAQDGRLALSSGVAQQDEAERRGDRQRDDHRREEREAVRRGEGAEERAGQALEEEDRQQRPRRRSAWRRRWRCAPRGRRPG